MIIVSKSTLMKKSIFRFLNKINKAVLPKLSDKDPTKLTKLQKGILAYRYFVLTNSLDWQICVRDMKRASGTKHRNGVKPVEARPELRVCVGEEHAQIQNMNYRQHFHWKTRIQQHIFVHSWQKKAFQNLERFIYYNFKVSDFRLSALLVF